MDNLTTLVNTNNDDVWEIELNRLFQRTLEAMMNAERRCRKLKAGPKEWSPTYAAARAAVRYWELSLKSLRGRKVCKRELESIWRVVPTEFKCDRRKKTEAQTRNILHAA